MGEKNFACRVKPFAAAPATGAGGPSAADRPQARQKRGHVMPIF